MRKEAGEVVEAGPYGAFVTTAINKILLQTIQLFSPSVCLSVCLSLPHHIRHESHYSSSKILISTEICIRKIYFLFTAAAATASAADAALNGKIF